MTLADVWHDYDNYKYSFWRKDVSRVTARKLIGVPRCGYEIMVDTRIHDGHKQTLYLQNISDAVFRFWVYTDVCAYQGGAV